MKKTKKERDGRYLDDSPEARCDRAKEALRRLADKCAHLADDLTAYDDEHTRQLAEWQKHLIRLALVDEVKDVQRNFIASFIDGEHPDILNEYLTEIAMMTMYLNE